MQLGTNHLELRFQRIWHTREIRKTIGCLFKMFIVDQSISNISFIFARTTLMLILHLVIPKRTIW